MKLAIFLLVIFCLTNFTVSWCAGRRQRRRPRRRHRHRRPRCRRHWGGYGGFGGFGGYGGYGNHFGSNFDMDVTKNTNVAAGVFKDSQLNMSNGGCGNRQINSKQKKMIFGGHGW